MLERTDRLALAVVQAEPAAESFTDIFDAEMIGDERDEDAGARRVTLQWGRDLVELYEPTGDGPAARFLKQGRRGLFLGGFSLADPAALAARLEQAGIRVCEQGDGRYVVFPEDLDGTGVVLSRTEERERVGLGDRIWQITYAASDLEAAIERYSALFGVEDLFTNRYPHEGFGYVGAITWFDARDGGRLDSLEYLEPSDPTKAVGRFVDRCGNGIYMASIETDDIPEIRRRVEKSGPGWDGADFGGFIHPRRLHGLLLGLVTYENWNARRPLPGSA
ncbi:MAG: VOC family protein [Deltaproteobacteria bacterium]|nr:VOC family protein [Deltaproteobacteria bacterium]MBW2414757.1 VOC family protein [Deltaproteobacteria bacterium]